MSIDDQVPGGNTQNPGGSPEPENPENNQGKKTVDFDSYKKALDEKKSLQKRLQEFESSAKAREEAELLEKENFKKLAETRGEELAKIKTDHEALNKRITDSKKFSAILKSINGQVPEQYWSLIDIDEVPVNEDGEPDETAVKSIARKFETTFKEVIKPASGAKMPNDAAKQPGAAITYEAWVKLPLKEKKERLGDVIQATSKK